MVEIAQPAYNRDDYTHVALHPIVVEPLPNDAALYEAAIAEERRDIAGNIQQNAWQGVGPMLSPDCQVTDVEWTETYREAGVEHVVHEVEALRAYVQGELAKPGNSLQILPIWHRYLDLVTIHDASVPARMRRALGLMTDATMHPKKFFGMPEYAPYSAKSKEAARIEAALNNTLGLRGQRLRQRIERVQTFRKMLYRLGVLGTGEALAMITEEHRLPAVAEQRRRVNQDSMDPSARHFDLDALPFYDPLNFRVFVSRPQLRPAVQ